MIVREHETMSRLTTEGTVNDYLEKRLGAKTDGAMIVP